MQYEVQQEMTTVCDGLIFSGLYTQSLHKLFITLKLEKMQCLSHSEGLGALE